jgi:hypothetical protein
MELRSGTKRQGAVSSHMGSFRTLASHLERVLIRDSWCSLRQAWSAVSIQTPCTGVDSVSRQLGGLIEPDVFVDRSRLSQWQGWAQLARIAR